MDGKAPGKAMRRADAAAMLPVVAAVLCVCAAVAAALVSSKNVGAAAAISVFGAALVYAVTFALSARLAVRARGGVAEDDAAEIAELREALTTVEARNRQIETALIKLEEVERIKKNFLLMASHQMRSPLVAIQSVIKVIVSGAVKGDDDVMRGLLQQAYIRSEDMLGMVNDILSLAEAKVERDEGSEQTDVPGELSNVVGLLRTVAAERGIEINLETCGGFPPCTIGRKNLNHIFTNLVENAVKYSKDNTEVKVILGTHDGRIMFEVEDQGIGIPAAEQEKIFKEFYRADNARALAKQGTGLGLAIVENIVRNLGGDIGFVSEENKGTKFTVTLPFSPEPPPEQDDAG